MADPVNKVVDTIPLPRRCTDLITFGSSLFAILTTDPPFTVDSVIGIHRVDPATKTVGPEICSGVGPLAMIDFHREFHVPDTIGDGAPDRRIYTLAPSGGFAEITPAFLDSVAIRPLDDTDGEQTGIQDFVASPTKTALYYADLGRKRVGIFDADAAKIVGSIQLTESPESLAVSPDGRYVYVAYLSVSEISRIDLAATPPQVTPALLSGTGFPAVMAVTPDGKRLVVGQIFGQSIFLYDLESHQRQLVPVGRQPGHVAVNAAGTRAYSSNYDTSTVCVVDLTLTPPRTIATVFGFAKPQGMSFSPDGRRLYVANSGPDGAGNHSISVVAV